MEITVTVADEVAGKARKATAAVGLTIEQAVFAYVTRLAEGAEPVANEFLPDGTLRRRTLREQLYRHGEFLPSAVK
jgi:hypothetical protein